MKPELLVTAKRANLIEREHFGYIVVVDKNSKIITRIGNDKNTPFFLRSCGKPFQALPIITSGAYYKYNIDLQELAVSSASHIASKDHVELVRNILNKINLNEDNLKCGSHDPIDTAMKNYLIKNDLKAGQVHNNCSGKHAGMLAVCMNNGWNINNYLDFDHPLQMEILSVIKKYCDIADNPERSLDGCSAPIYALPLFKLGVGLLNLFLSKEAELLRKAYSENPVLIGGKGRLDSSIIEATKGRLISKVGAEGLCVVINTEEEKALVVKISDADQKARSISVIESLKQLGWLDNNELNNKEILNLNNREIRNFNDILVGKIEPAFKIKSRPV